MLDSRKKRVLQAIIEEYINTAEPVSSAAITINHGLNCSSATKWYGRTRKRRIFR